MSLTLNARHVGSQIILEASGQIEAGESCLQLNEFSKRLISGGARSFVFDLARVSYIDSAGLGLLLSIYATLRLQGGEMKLLNVGTTIKEALTITNLIQIFEILEDEPRAS
jgi:anti-sigma B factor antagonist